METVKSKTWKCGSSSSHDEWLWYTTLLLTWALISTEDTSPCHQCIAVNSFSKILDSIVRQAMNHWCHLHRWYNISSPRYTIYDCVSSRHCTHWNLWYKMKTCTWATQNDRSCRCSYEISQTSMFICLISISCTYIWFIAFHAILILIMCKSHAHYIIW